MNDCHIFLVLFLYCFCQELFPKVYIAHDIAALPMKQELIDGVGKKL